MGYRTQYHLPQQRKNRWLFVKSARCAVVLQICVKKFCSVLCYVKNFWSAKMMCHSAPQRQPFRRFDRTPEQKGHTWGRGASDTFGKVKGEQNFCANLQK
jgi:hypothetical protein